MEKAIQCLSSKQLKLYKYINYLTKKSTF